MVGSNPDKLLNLAFALHSNPGVYALLLGSGVSRSAGIPTGWEIVLDLIQRLAEAGGTKGPPDPEQWYRDKFGEPPEYTRVVARLAATPAERRGLLRRYFEPSEEEKEQGLKLPTSAHRAIARLCKLGYIQIILTTNFDRLLQTALSDEGVAPDVVGSPDALKGAVPYVHSKCMVVKLHGDYLDTRIKNTTKELSSYSAALNTLLDRILDEFGLIVCGWSGEWDTALVDAIMRCPSRRFTTYWFAHGQLSDDGERATRQRRAVVVPIAGADEAFSRLLEQVESFGALGRRHPLSRDLAVATTKRYLAEHRFRIPLHDLIQEELEKLDGEIRTEGFGLYGPTTQPELTTFYQQRLHRYEALADNLLGVAAALSYYDAGDNAHLLTSPLERLSTFPLEGGSNVLIALRRYPALLLLYAAGVLALLRGNFRNLAELLYAPRVRDEQRGTKVPALKFLNVWTVFNSDGYRLVPRPNAAREYTPANLYIKDLLQPVLQDYASGDRYEEAFDLFEYLLGLTYADVVRRDGVLSWAPFGSFAWKYWGMFSDWKNSPLAEFVASATGQGGDWPPLAAGFFGGSPERFSEVVSAYNGWLDQARGRGAWR